MQDVLDTFHPLIGGWFRERFGSPTEPQRIGWPKIAAGEDVLIAAPTGSGKTLAAFLACLDALVRRGLADGRLDEHTAILYVSPLKALSNDVQRNLEAPLHELTARAAKDGVKLPAIRVAVRTGDTPMSERERLAKHPPHILVTTPESLFILLTTVRGRAALSRLHTVIVDEIHAIAGDKRGAHLALSLERLDRLVVASAGKPPIRVGLSATQRPIEQIARLLVGMRRPLPHIVDAGHRRELDLAIEITDDELGAVATNEQFARVFDRIAELVAQHRSTIVFVNTRRLVERTAAALEQRLGEEHVVAHHGSMSRALRLAAEQKLKHGRVKAAVATASLELGIDVGTVDLVVQLGSPRSIATLIQRVGRSGHTLGATPKGRMFALTRDQLMECAALVRGVRRGNLDAICVRDAPLDILAQQMVAACAAEDIPEAELVAMMRGATPYANISDERIEQLLVMLAEGVSDRRGRAGAYLHRDRIGGMLKARRGARLAAITSGGAIPDNNNYTVVQWPDETPVGTVDEDFAIDSSPGDIFQLGNTSWKIRRIEMARVLVEDARGQPPTIPFWFGEAPARTRELSDELSDLRREIDVRISAGDDPDAIAAWLASETGMALRAAQQATAYLTAGRAALGALPRRDLIVAERFFDEGGGMQLVIHAPLGGRINRAWGLALRKKFCVSFDFELQAAATDDGIVISLGQPHSFPLDTVFGFVPSHQTEDVLVQALLDRPMFEIRWRWNVTRSLTVLRRRNGKKVPPHLIKMRAADTLSVVFPQALACGENIVGPRVVPDHPLVFETVRDCLVEAMDSAGLRELLEQLERGEIQVMAKDTVEPSPLSHELINANPYAFLDDAPLEERRTRAVQLRRGLPPDTVEAAGQLDAAAIALATEEVAPTVRDIDELHDALLALWLVPEPLGASWDPHAADWFAALCASGRATRLVVGDESATSPSLGVTTSSSVLGAATNPSGDVRDGRADTADSSADGTTVPAGVLVAWCATERLGAARAVFGEDVAAQPMIATPSWAARPAREEALVKIIGAHLDHRGPVSTRALAAELGIALPDTLAALLALEGDGAILRGSFTAADLRPARRTVREALAASDDSAALGDVEWCNRRVLARIHRLTLARLRREIEPVSSTVLMRFLARWQRVARGSQLIGSDGLVRVLEQLQGFETAAGAWEREVLPARLHGYDSTWLDQLCLAGQVVWCRLSPRKAKDEAAEPPPTAEEASELLAAIAHVANATPPLEQFPPTLRAAIAAGDRAAAAVLAATPRGKGTADIIGHLEYIRERERDAASTPRGSRVFGNPHDLDPRGSRVSDPLNLDPRGSRASGNPHDLDARHAADVPRGPRASGDPDDLAAPSAADVPPPASGNPHDLDPRGSRVSDPHDLDPRGSPASGNPHDLDARRAADVPRGPRAGDPDDLAAPSAADVPRGSRASGNPHDLDPRGSRVSDPHDLDRRGSRASGNPHDLDAPRAAADVPRGPRASGDPHDLAAPRAADVPRGPRASGDPHDLAAPRAADVPRGPRASGDPHDLTAPRAADVPRGRASGDPHDLDPRGSRASGDPHDLPARAAFVVVNETRAHVCAKREPDDNAQPRIDARAVPRGTQPFGMRRLDPEIATMVATTAERRDAAAAAVEATIAAARAADATRLESAVAAVAAIAGKYGMPPAAVAALVTNVVVPPPGRIPRNAPSRSAPLALMLRRDVGWLRAAAAVGSTEQPVMSGVAARVRDHLAAHGASFLADLVATIDANPDQIEDALWELVGAGLATADGFASLRVLVDRKRGEVKSHFDRTETTRTALGGVPPVRKWQEAIRRARTRDRERPSHALRSLPTAAGRWSLLPAIVPLTAVPASALRAVAMTAPTVPAAPLHTVASALAAAPAAPLHVVASAPSSLESSALDVAAGTPETSTIDVEASARQLLLRYGVVFRDLLQRESSLPPWRDLLVALRRLEARGEIRGGRFVTGFVGEQFALPEALDELRAARTAGTTPEVFRVAATDPLNLVGVLTPGPRVSAILGNAVLYVDGHAVASLEAGTLVPREPCPPGGYVDDDLVYHPPPRPVQVIAQAALPL